MTAESQDRYDIQDELGRGGSAAVYRAYDRTLERFVAIKVLSGPIANDPEFLARFEREARVAARLDHPNIVAIHDVGTLPDGRPFIAMRLLEGSGLERLLAAGVMPWDQTVSVLQQVAAALDYTHERGTVHRDIKPSNVIIDPTGRATLTDFGIARALDSARVTMTGLTVGTPRYMAPEQIRGDEVTGAADTYSLAVMAFEMLSGRAPFDGEGTALMFRIVHEPPPSITTLNAALPPAIADVLNRALEKEPEDRWPSAGALVAALAEALQGDVPGADRTIALAVPATIPVGIAAAASPPSSPPVATGAGGGDRRRLYVLGGAAAAAVLALVFMLVFAGGGDDADTAAGATTPTATAQATASPTATRTPFVFATQTSTPARTATATASPVATVAPVVVTAAPTVVATAAPTAVATAAPTVAATVAPTPAYSYSSNISGIALQGGTYVVQFSVGGFPLTGSVADRHVHFFFDTVTSAQAGVPGGGPWFAYGGGSPFTGYSSGQRGAASQMCILVANPDHSVIQGTGNCVALP